MRDFLFLNLTNAKLLTNAFIFFLAMGLVSKSHACIPTLPITGSAQLMGVGNSFIGRYGSSCRNVGQLLELNGDEETINGTCDVMYGFPLESMLDEQVIQNAESGTYDIGMFISGPLAAMEAFSQLYSDNCMAPMVLMTWESLNPANGVEAYRTGIAAIAQRVRDLENTTDARVIPYGLILYHLSLNPPAELAHLPVGYLYDPDHANGPNIHDNVFSFWLKANAIYATLLQRSPEGIPHDLSFYQWGGRDHPLLQSGLLSEHVIRDMQRRIWRLTERWQSGEPVASLMEFEPDLTPRYNLTVGQGTGDGIYQAGAEVTIRADVAPAGWIFDGWDGATEYLSSQQNTTTLTMPAQDISITARYRQQNDVTHYPYLRLEITEVINNGTLHLTEINWLDSQGESLFASMQGNQQAGQQLTTSYPAAGGIYYAFDRNTATRFYLSTQTQNVPIQVIIQNDQSVSVGGVQLSVPTWNNNLRGFRCWGSQDGTTWELLFEEQNATAYFSPTGAISSAFFSF